ncbi:MAG: response regulator [Rhodocyclaceae bacterium]|nr:response regulator [Rhodocyclaceae bacterium]
MPTPPKILVIDDEPLNLEIIAEHLEEMACEVFRYASADEAWGHLQALPANPYDLVLLDRMMPGMDGIQLLRLLKVDARFKQVPVVMQTAANSPEEVRQGIAAGAFYYLAKPYSGRELLAIVQAALKSVPAPLELGKVQDQLVGDVFEFSTLTEARTLAHLLSLRCPQPELAAMGLAELLVNAIEHGNLGICYEQKRALRLADRWEAEIERRLALSDQAGRKAKVEARQTQDAWTFTVTDCGNGFDWQRYLTIDPERVYDPNGRGIAMAKQLCFSSLEYLGCGNTAVAIIRTDRTDSTLSTS